MTETTLFMSDMEFAPNTAHIDVLNRKCRELFAGDPDLLLVRVYRDGLQYEDKNLLGLIYRPGHAGYYADCGQIIWKYLRAINANDGEGVLLP